MQDRARAAGTCFGRARLRLLVCSLPFLLPLAVAQAAAQGASEVRIQTIELGSGIAMLVGRGGNIAVATGAEGTLLVDDQFAPLSSKIRAAVAALGDEPIRFILNTHWHGDHTGGNEAFGTAGAVIVAHANVRLRMSTEQWNPFREQTTPPSPAAALPLITFEDGLRFHLSGQTIEVFHVAAAHTDGDSIVRFREADVVHLGDLYFNGFYPYVDLASGGSIDGMIAGVKRALEITGPKTRVIPGHGPLSDRAGLERYLDMLATARSAVQQAMAGGQGVDEVVASRPTKDLDEKWGGGFLAPEDFVRIVYASLRQGGP